MKLIAFVLGNGNPKKRDSITTYMRAKEYPFWHWIDDFWLVQVPDEVTSKSLQMEIEELPGVVATSMLAFEVSEPVRYWGRAHKDAWTWLRNVGSPSD